MINIAMFWHLACLVSTMCDQSTITVTNECICLVILPKPPLPEHRVLFLFVRLLQERSMLLKSLVVALIKIQFKVIHFMELMK